MKIKDLKQEELDAISYDDLAYMILKESKKKLKINDLFQEVCKILGLGNDVFENKIADFFELLSTDKKFIMIDKGYWDIREKHSSKIKIEVDDDDFLTETIEKIEDEDAENNEDEDIFYEADENEDEVDNDLKDLVLVTDDDDDTNGLM